jgi:hypothetical protein
METFLKYEAKTITVNDTAVIMTGVNVRHRISTTSLPSLPFLQQVEQNWVSSTTNVL